MTLVEVVVVLMLMGVLIVAVLNSITLLDRSARRQALHTSAMELAQGKIEELESLAYNPPTLPFAATTVTQTTNVVLALAKSGTNTLVEGTMKTVISPVAQAHLVIVTVTVTNAAQPLQVTMQTVLNPKSGCQP